MLKLVSFVQQVIQDREKLAGTYSFKRKDQTTFYSPFLPNFDVLQVHVCLKKFIV